MTRKEFMNELDYRLRSFPENERIDALNYYEEYFDDAGVGPDDKVPEGMQPIKEIVAQLRSEYIDRAAMEKPKSVKNGISAVWIAILGIFAAPIALPILIAVLAIVFAICVTIAVLLFAGIVSGVAIAGSGIFCVGAALPVFTSSLASGIFTVGIGLMLFGAGILLLLLIVYLVRISCYGIVRIFRFITNRFSRK